MTPLPAMAPTGALQEGAQPHDCALGRCLVAKSTSPPNRFEKKFHELAQEGIPVRENFLWGYYL